ncbi:MAG: 7TM diverse intracellular signaling domain-containing protein [Anaerolineae bacterium]
MASTRRVASFVIAGVFLALTLSACSAAAQQPGPSSRVAELADSAASMSLDPYIEVLQDPAGQLGIDEVSGSGMADRFAPVASTTWLADVAGQPPWVRFTVRNPLDHAAAYYVQVAAIAPTAVAFYAPDESAGTYRLVPSGASRPEMPLPLPSRSFVYPVTIPARGEVTYYIRPDNASVDLRMPLALWRPLAFEQTDKTQSAAWGALIGSLLATAVLSLLLSVGLRERSFLLLAAFAGAFALLTLASGSASMQLIRPDQPVLWGAVYQILVVATIVTFISFSDAFLALKAHLPAAHRLALFAIGVILASLLLAPLGLPRVASFFLVVIGTLAALGLIAAAVILWRQGSKSARYFLLAACVPILAGLVSNMARMGVGEWQPWFALGDAAMVLVLILLISLALVDNVDQLRRQTAESVRRRERYLDAIPVGIAVYDAQLMPVYVNNATATLIGMQGRLGNRSYTEARRVFPAFVAATDTLYPQAQLPMIRALNGEAAHADDFELEIGGARVALDAWAQPLLDADGKVEAVVSTFLDITARRKTEAELASYREHLEELVAQRTESERRQREVAEALQETSAALARSIDRQEVLSTILQELRRVFDYDGALVALVEDGDLVVREAAGRWEDVVERRAPLNDALPMIESLKAAHGRLWSDLAISAALVPPVAALPLMSGAEAIGLLAVVTTPPSPPDADTLRVLQAFADQATTAVINARLYQQAHLVAAAEERARLARDLHDAVTQTLCSAQLLAGTALRLWADAPPPARHPVELVRTMLVSAVAEMRLFLIELRPSALSLAPLDTLLTYALEAFGARTHVAVTSRLGATGPQPPEDVRIAVFRITQEALSNITRHARAQHVTVAYTARPGSLSLSIADDGCGFDPSTVDADHLGLEIMRERATATGLSLDIISAPYEGTRVVVRWGEQS